MELKDLSKKKTLIILICILAVGSFISFYAGNLLMSDLSNMFYGVHDIYIISSFPMALLILYFVLGFLFIIRYYRYPKYRKNLINLYTIYFGIIGLIGVVVSILTGTIIYHNMFAPYPFWGYTIIMLIVHLVSLVLSIYYNVVLRKKINNDEEKRTFKIQYILTTIVLVVLSVMALYRFGSFLWMPIYAQGRTLYLTIWFYIWVCLPMAIIVHIILYFLDVYKNYKQAIIYTAIIFGLHIALGIVVVSLMRGNPVFISAISPALPLERLATSPMDTYIELIGIAIIGAWYLFYSIRSRVRELKNN